jgi:hypothetical protein
VVRTSRTPSQQTIAAAEKHRDVGALNQEFRRLGKEEWNHAEIYDTKSATGLGLVARHEIQATENAPFRLCEYEGTWKPLPAQERIADVPMRDLMYGVEVSLPPRLTDRTGTQRRWRIVADHPTDNIGRYGNAPDGSSPPNARLVLRKGGRVWVEIISPIPLGAPILIDYGPYYWIYPLLPRSSSNRLGGIFPSPPSGRAKPSPLLPTASGRLSATTWPRPSTGRTMGLKQAQAQPQTQTPTPAPRPRPQTPPPTPPCPEDHANLHA